MDRIFPDEFKRKPCYLRLPAEGSTKPFSTLVTNTMPDLQFMFNGQCFPRYQYSKPMNVQDMPDTLQGIGDVPERIDNITDTAR